MRNKLIAAGLGLVSYGALLGWAVTGDRLEAKMKSNQRLLADIIEKKTTELEAMKSLYLVSGPILERDNESAESESDSSEEAVVETVDPRYRGETPEQTRSNLQGLIEGYTANKEDVDAFAHMASRVVDDGPDNTPPFVISKAKYAWDEEEGSDYAKITVTYYPKDRVLLDDGDEPVENKEIDNMIGWRNLDRFGDESEDADVVFVRNRRMETDFEVVRDDENPLPAHVRYGFGRTEFDAHKEAGLIKFRSGDV